MNQSQLNVTSHEITVNPTKEIFDGIFNCGFVNGISTFCIIGNIFNIIILSRHGLSNSTNIILLSLAVLDLFFGLMTFVKLSTACLCSVFNKPMSQNLLVYYGVTISLSLRCTESIASTHIVFISIERLMAVYLPLKVSRLFSVKVAKVFIIISYLLWVIAYSPIFPLYTFSHIFDPSINFTRAILEQSDYFKENFSNLRYFHAFVISGVRGPIFLFVISLASMATYYKLFNIVRERSHITSSAAKYDVKAVKMLFTVCMVYLVLGIPSSVPVLLYHFGDFSTFYNVRGNPTYITFILESVKELLYVINASANFVIYVMLSTKFSQTYKSLIRGC